VSSRISTALCLTFAQLVFASVLLASALAGSLLPATAQARGTAQLTAGFSPYRLGRSTTLKLTMRLGVAGAPGELPPPVTRFEMRLPAKLELVSSSLGLSVCQPATLLSGGAEACPPDARLGFGSALLRVPLGPLQVGESARLEAEMGPPVGEETGVLLYAEAGTPVAADLLFPGVLLGGSNQNLSTSVPLIPSLPGAADISLVQMSLSLGPEGLTYTKDVRGRTVDYRPEGVALPAHCPRGGFRFGAQIGFADGSTATASSTVPCPSAQHQR
jgi:hypothetical protein